MMFDKEFHEIIKSLNTPGAARSWLVIGPKGVGKKQFAQQIITKATATNNDYNPNAKWIECDLTDTAKREIQKALLAGEEIENKEWTKKTEITVDDVRDGCHFLSLKSDKIKVLVFNLADDMNENAQNALLKTLEEPYPNTLILLLCENVGHLLPTIISRCQKITLHTLNNAEMKSLLKTEYPDIDEGNLKLLSELAQNNIGFAKQIMELNALDNYSALISLLVPQSQLYAPTLLAFAEDVAHQPELFEIIRHFILDWLVKQAKKASISNLDFANRLTELYDCTQALFTTAESLNLDKKQVLIRIIHQISEVL